MKAFNAVLGSSALLQQLSFAIPAALLIYRRVTAPGYLPANRSFRVLVVLGYVANATVVIWTLITLVVFCWPPAQPVTGTSMSEFHTVSPSFLADGSRLHVGDSGDYSNLWGCELVCSQ